MKKLGFILFVFLFVFVGSTVSANSLEQRIAVTQKSSTGITASCDVNEEHTLYAALYKNTELVSISSSNTKEVTLSFRINQEDDYVVKLFCWGGANNMTPLSLPLTVECSDLYDTGILKNIYKKAGGDYYAQVITSDGTEQEYAIYYWDVQEYRTNILNSPYDEVIYSDQNPKVAAYPQQVIRYTIDSSDKLVVKDQLSPTVSSQSNNGYAAYNSQTNSMGNLKIGKGTTILDISEADDNDKIKNITTTDLVNGLNYKAYGYMQSDNNSSSSIVLIAASDAIFDIGLLQESNNGAVNIYSTDKDYAEAYTIEEGYYISIGKEKTLSDHIDEIMRMPPNKRFVRYLHGGSSLYDIEMLNREEHNGTYTANAVGNYTLLSDYINYYDEADGIIRISKNALKTNCEYTVDIFRYGNWSYELVFGGELSEDDMYSVGILKNIYKKAGGDYYAQVIPADGTEQEYAIYYWDVQEYRTNILNSPYDEVIYSDQNPKVEAYPQQVIRYTIDSSDRLVVKDQLSPTVSSQSNNGYAAYSILTNSIGDVRIGKDTIILDISEADNDNITVIANNSLKTGSMYKAYGYLETGSNYKYSKYILYQR